ncbi:MAG TPA: pantoate--beta-alanine ligase [Candidatus Binatia bacterium]|nr:pantoate--beta-alanine ligase [Candidatus Binatia bacterium]
MQIIDNISAMRAWSESERRSGRRIALVPTMGFLHRGHLCLVRDAKARADRLVVSIFVNPTQFGPGEDFAGYPRDFERDREFLKSQGVDVLFHPTVAEMYPPGAQTHVDVERLSLPLCGALRPGHFRGVATVVAKLFNIVLPHVAVFGEKDYQQLQLIRRLVRDLSLGVEIIGHPIVREPDGLAMSSRNAYLSEHERAAAVCLSRALCKAERLFRRGERSAAGLVRAALSELEKEALAVVEYVKLCDAETLDVIERIDDSAVLALAIRIGKARLIDNRVFPAPEEYALA